MNFINSRVSRFTFLITLFLLLFVSTAIAFRTYIIRRQYHRGEPLGDPVIPLFPRSTESTVPAIYDVCFTPGTSSWHDMWVRDRFSTSLDMQTGFIHIQPVSVQLLKKTPPDIRETENVNSTAMADNLTPIQSRSQPALTRFGALLSPRATAPHGQPPAPSPAVEINEGAIVQVVVAVAMPTPHQNQRCTSDEEKQDNLHMPSEIALGVTKLTVATGPDTGVNPANI
jgi:hypothetical protein